MAATDSFLPYNNTAGLTSFITVCKNRLHHLRETLPFMTRQSAAEIIVVDYGCPQGTGAWVREYFPQVRMVEVSDDEGLCVARGRNLGAAQAHGDRLCFVDADIFLHRDIGLWAREEFKQGRYYRASPSAGVTAWGTFLCAREDFASTGGYDEAFRRWGGEDIDLYHRLDEANLVADVLPEGALAAIAHGDDERLLGKAPNRAVLVEANRVYLQAKQDITRLLGRPPALLERVSLMNMIDSKVLELAASRVPQKSRIEIQVSHGINQNGRKIKLQRRLVYVLEAPISAKNRV